MTYEVEPKSFKRFLMRALKEARYMPRHYPDVKELDTLMNDPAFQESAFARDVLYFIVANMICGFPRDDAWHEMYPGHREETFQNAVYYLMTPCGLLTPHVGIWEEGDNWRAMEDRQAAFEYMQGIILDGSLYSFASLPDSPDEGTLEGPEGLGEGDCE